MNGGSPDCDGAGFTGEAGVARALVVKSESEEMEVGRVLGWFLMKKSLGFVADEGDPDGDVEGYEVND